MSAAPATVLRLGDARLRARSTPVDDLADPAFRADAERLAATLRWFRARHGFGRAIAAPQIGVARRFLALDLGSGCRIAVDPEIVWRSGETFALWDDCMSMPELLVRVRRHASISVRFRDLDGATHVWQRLDRATSELIQHEIDHLDGVLMVDRALDGASLRLRDRAPAVGVGRGDSATEPA